MSKPLSPNATAVIAGLLMVLGGFLAMNALGWATMDASRLRAPRDVLLCAALIFGLPGITLLLGPRMPTWLGGLASATVFTAFALIPLWIGFGDGPRAFGGNVASLLSLAGQGGVVLSLGRIAFGVAGVLVALFAVFAWWAWLIALPQSARPLGLLALLAVAWWLGWGRYQEPPAATGSTLAQQLSGHIEALHADPDFKVSRIGGGKNDYVQPVAEQWVKQALNRLTSARQAPAGQPLLSIPRTDHAPTIDGRVQPGEWQNALSVALLPLANGARIHFLHDGSRLYMAATVPSDTTEKGYDQLRVVLHQQLTPDFGFERMHIGRGADATALRSVETGTTTRLHQTHWRIYPSLQGVSTVQSHRHFETSVDLAEAGLLPGAAFPVSVEVEGDPVLNASGKFQARRIEGRSDEDLTKPLWMRLAP